ncbi:hypothetical protein H072_7497 [Dactylellina haptotyla CBS 200.50]|uniref:Uncharacterized protein n=1 Tax=Dactylellina haptotyla (strain CBS 200.50) TaxID=1284197 RepID=S8ACE9_DACHA|nr:hypothetical protein H072_7497 [Dactylellina haptotyla CBS 200.50]
MASNAASTRPKRRAVAQRKPIIVDDDAFSSDDSQGQRARRRPVLGAEALDDSDEFEPQPDDGGVKDFDELVSNSKSSRRRRSGPAPDDASPDEASLDEDEGSDLDGEPNGAPSTPTRQTARVLRKKKGKSWNTPVALHRRMIRRMKDISYWGDHEVDPTALERKEAARPFIYDISAPSRKNTGKVSYFDFEKEAQDLAKDVYIENARSSQELLPLARTSDAPEIAKYFWQFPKRPLSILLGPFTNTGQQKKFQLKMYDSVDLRSPELFPDKNGWVIHTGNEVQSIDWATRQSGPTQFLAIGTKFQEAKPAINNLPPGFAPCVCPSQIQIWRIPITTPDSQPKPSPSIDHTLLTDWGAPTGIKWRPGNAPIQEPGTIGHLVALFEDGQARLIQVQEHSDSATPSTSSPIFKLTNPMLTLYLEDTIFTVFTWINHHTLAFGCANGSVALYDLNTIVPGKEHLPKSYYSIAASYISSICSLAPSFPHLIATYSMDGSFNIHDIREPGTSNTLVHRSRTVAMSPPIAWSEMAQSLCYPEDLSGVLCMGIRKAKKSGGFLCTNNPGDTIASSTGGGNGLHPFLLNGGRDGKVRIVNLIRKYFYSKCQAMQQVWFQLEYAASSEMYRMLDGFKPEMVVHRNRVSVGLPFYPYQTNITKVCWNNNRGYGTWAAAGTGCGIVRVEDVSLDVGEGVAGEDDEGDSDVEMGVD